MNNLKNVAHCDIPTPGDLNYGTPGRSVFQNALLHKQKEWVLQNIRDQKLNRKEYKDSFPIDEKELSAEVQEQLLKEIEAQADLGLIMDFITTLMILDPEAKVWLQSIQEKVTDPKVLEKIHFFLTPVP